MEDQRIERKQRKQDWLDRFGMKQAYKHADIPEDGDLEEMNFQSDNRRYGLDGKGVAAIIAGTLLAGGLGVGGTLAALKMQQPTTLPPAVVQPVELPEYQDTDTDTQYRLEFGE